MRVGKHPPPPSRQAFLGRGHPVAALPGDRQACADQLQLRLGCERNLSQIAATYPRVLAEGDDDRLPIGANSTTTITCNLAQI